MNDLVLLTALLREPAYGYALKKTAGLIFGSGAMHNNVIYPSLSRFVRNRWVVQARVPGARGQERKQYRITTAGRKYLLEQIGTFGAQEARDEGAFLLRVALFDILRRQKREAIVAARKTFLAARAAELSQLQKAVGPRSFGAVALHRVQNRVKDEIRWIRKMESKVETNTGDRNARKHVHTRL
jgi:DNA-binding PadR family transcriptional regulator